MKRRYRGLFDFYIITRPHSGSHMLASALDSHPDIQCTGEIGMNDKLGNLGASGGKVKGCITHLKAFNFTRENVKVNDVDKFIVLTRGNENKPLLNLVKNKKHIVLSYEGLTKDKNIKHIPKQYSNIICDFLGVERMKLKTSFIKNKVSTWGKS